MSIWEKLFWHRLALILLAASLAFYMGRVEYPHMPFVVWSAFYLTALTLRLVYLAGRRKGQARE